MISVIIPNYNGESNLKKNLPKVLGELSDRKDTEIIVVDDASTDNSLEILEKISGDFPQIKIIKNFKNKGFAPTVNTGVKNAQGEILVLLNSDVYPKKDFLNASLNDIKDPQVFAVGFMDESVEGEKKVLRGRGIGSWKRGFLVHSAGSLDKKSNLWASGGSSMFRRDIWEKLSGLDEIYAPFYWEDIDLSYRALKTGYKVLFEKDSVVVHEHEEGSIKKNYKAKKIKKIAYRNQFIFVWKNASLPLVISNILWLPYNLVKTLVNGELAFGCAFLSAFVLLPRILIRRERVQKTFKLKDKEVILYQ